MATSKIIDFGPQHKRASRFRQLRICLRSRGVFGTIRWYYRLWRYGPFNEVMLPVIKNDVFPHLLIEDLVSVQPMSGPAPSSTIRWENLDEKSPKVGQIFSDGLKDPKHCGCCSPRWYKIWTGSEWVFEKNISQEEWKTIVTKFHPKK